MLPLRDAVATIDPRLGPEAAAEAGVVGAIAPPGPWKPPETFCDRGRLGLVVSGALVRRRAGRRTDLFLEGELCQASRDPADRWRVVSTGPAQIAMVSASTAGELAAVPGAVHALMLAAARHAEWNAELRSIVGVQRIEVRIARFFDYLARRIGCRDGDAIRIPLCLHQKRIEEILGTGHTRATSVFRGLVDAGVLVHDAGGWLLTE